MLSFSRKYRAWIGILTLIAVIAYGLTLTSPNIFGMVYLTLSADGLMYI